jgi:hypothetical protein
MAAHEVGGLWLLRETWGFPRGEQALACGRIDRVLGSDIPYQDRA